MDGFFLSMLRCMLFSVLGFSVIRGNVLNVECNIRTLLNVCCLLCLLLTASVAVGLILRIAFGRH